MEESYRSDYNPPYYVGHHESRRTWTTSFDILEHARNLGYDMLTSPITNKKYHLRILSQLSAVPASSTSVLDRFVPTLLPLNFDETDLAPNEVVPQLLLTASPWIDLTSPDPVIADVSKQVLYQEASHAAFCGASNLIVHGPQSQKDGRLNIDGLSQYARAIRQVLDLGLNLHVQMLLPMTDVYQNVAIGDMGDLVFCANETYLVKDDQDLEHENVTSWDVWNLVRTVCKYSSRLCVALTLPRQLASVATQNKWFAEPVRILEIPKNTFVANKLGVDVLHVRHQKLIHRFMTLKIPPWLLLTDVGPLPGLESFQTPNSPLLTSDKLPFVNNIVLDQPLHAHPTPAEASNKPPPRPEANTTHIQYVREHIQERRPQKNAIERYASGYEDYLQNPLQPLTDNLESITYEVFEKDPIKYEWYDRAIGAALIDWAALRKPTDASGPEGRVIIAVVGAGRGPLVSRALQASLRTGVAVDLWAVEKNPSAVITLQKRNVDQWNNQVTVVQSDMRSWRGPTYSSDTISETAPSIPQSFSLQDPSLKTLPVDILISELLGSFADNELSPECLDGVQHLLNPVHGISIPTSYTAHLSPISAPKIYADINSRTLSGEAGQSEIPYVVMLHAVDYLSTKYPPTDDAGQDEPGGFSKQTLLPNVQEVWQFTHPLPKLWTDQMLNYGTSSGGNAHNTRFSKLEFPCRNRGVCHGLAGFFETILYAPLQLDDEGSEKESFSTAEQVAQPDDVPAAATVKEPIELSTNPLTMERKSKDMISWFPIYFPLKTPLHIPDNAELHVSMWRQTDGRKVWYEWLVEVFMVVSGTNSKTRKVRLGSSELHTSVKNACLM